ncbi:hypothetical protein BDA96_02G291900 [Sorghum bicolor]|uniref:Uncharacterized protein n=2 Tax=Sorghum bicolor TaxID=4558 RepID=A0A921RR75_SORBI|nr:hypothetical protein BDA96_02G291900 [Sorghum bicolor]OQU89822.1 hypothetical protein SORBI_3002G277432 [Sorghum bicolor]
MIWWRCSKRPVLFRATCNRIAMLSNMATCNQIATLSNMALLHKGDNALTMTLSNPEYHLC